MSASIIAVTNQKGGVGKTTTAVNLATAMAACGLEVLLVDFDPQGNASTGLGIEEAQRQANSYRILTGEVGAGEAILPTPVPGLSILPAVMDLSAAEVELSDLDGREFRLSQALESQKEQFHYIIIDCPPSLGLLTVNGLCAATSFMVPLQCEFYALEGLAQLMKTVSVVRANFNPEAGFARDCADHV